jgi:hypothetical protein
MKIQKEGKFYSIINILCVKYGKEKISTFMGIIGVTFYFSTNQFVKSFNIPS